jgi:hypothetical protein
LSFLAAIAGTLRWRPVARIGPAALAAGGRDNGGPGPRPEYAEGYYGAFVLDPDGHNVEAVFHGG